MISSKRKTKRKLTRFGKIFFASIFIVIISVFSMLLSQNKSDFYKRVETNDYLVEINYPNLNSKTLFMYSKNYIDEKEKEFVSFIDLNGNASSSKYEFKNYYEVIDTDNILGVHLVLYEYMGGAHYMRDDKTYYYSKDENKMVLISDFLENDNSLNKLSSLSFYYVMKYSDENNLNFNEEWVRDGLSPDLKNFEYFNFIDDGLEITFPPYQVSCWADGEIKILIPYSELEGVIKSKYLKYSKSESIDKNYKRDLEKYRGKKLIAFTFDDGPSFIGTNKLLDNLDRLDARVTFFVLGSRIKDYKKTLKRASDMENLIGSHTYSHSNFFALDNYSIIKEIKDTNALIKEVTGEDVIYLRPPYGNINKEIKELTNMYTVLWSLDPEDWKYKDANKIANYIVCNAYDGAVVLLHDLYESSVDGAILAMERLGNEGYAFVTIEEMAILKNVTLNKENTYYKI